MLAPEIFSFFAFALIIGLGIISNFFLHRLNSPPIKIRDEEKHRGSFIAERAYNNLKILNDYGPKVVGSSANEERAFNFIWNHLHEIQNASLNKADITINHQVVSGTLFRPHNAMYKNIQNILVRVQGVSDHVVMVNCHFDSVPGSPGASDDIVMCCVMMEMLRVLGQKAEKQKHSIVFLFNGSEEEDLQASHGFITQHRWAKDVRAYINLESTGSGGREILFRSGPKHDWLVHLYRQSAPRPFGQGVAEELFETGIIPSATDFEIFRDDGEVPGLDFAYVEDGWRYHTQYDSIDYITMDSVQYTGENILPLLRTMVNSDKLADPPEGTFAIYFDWLGLFMISYTYGVGIALNISISLLAFIIPFVIQTKFKLANLWFVFTETLISFLTLLVSTILSAVACYLMAMIMNAADNTMSWFNIIFLAIGIYGSLAVVVQMATYHLIQCLTDKFFKRKHDEEKTKSAKGEKLQIHLNGVTLFWTILTLVIVIMGYRFAYITMVITLFSLCTYLLTFTLCKFLPATRIQSWIFVHLLGHSFLFLWICYMMIQVLELFIPITTKQYYANPDIMISLICCLWSVICLSYFMPLTRFVRFRAILYSMLLLTFVVSLILSFTSVGFPYSDNKSDPRLQRFRVFHTKRSFYDHDGTKTFSESGFMLSTFDRNSIRTLESSFNPENLIDFSDDDQCGKNVYCGFPLYRFPSGKYLKGLNQNEPIVEPTSFKVLHATRNPNNVSQVMIEFTLQLRTLTIIFITGNDGWNIRNTTHDATPRYWRGSEHFYSKITYGKSTSELMRETVTLDGPNTADPLNVATFTIMTIESVFEKSQELNYVMGRIPDYTSTMVHQADSSSYIVKIE